MTNESALLQLMVTPGFGNKTLGRLLLTLDHAGLAPEHVVELSPQERVRCFRLPPKLAVAIDTARDQATSMAEKLDRRQIRILALGMPGYPERLQYVLQNDAPPLLFARGNLSLLDQPSVGFAGSRNASERGLQFTRSAAAMLAQRDVNVVSGYANGVDLEAHTAALKYGGTTTMVLAEGILHFNKPKGELSEYITESNSLVISEFPPDLRWIARNAMQRNRIIIGLSWAMLIVESGLDGGTFAAGEETLRLERPLFVMEYATPPPSAEGNGHFLQHGAQGVRGNRDGDPNMSGIFRVLDGNSSLAPQLKTPTLFDVPAVP